MSKLERVAFAIWLEWSRHTIRHRVGKIREETQEEAARRRWGSLPPITRSRFAAEARAAMEAMG